MTGVCRAVNVVVLLGIITSVASHETKLVGENANACAGPSTSPLSIFIALKAVSFISRLSYICLYVKYDKICNMTYIDKYVMLYICFYTDDSFTYVYHKNC